jgi:hypothetical protein
LKVNSQIITELENRNSIPKEHSLLAQLRVQDFVHDRWKHLEDPAMVARPLLRSGRNLDLSMTGVGEKKVGQSAAGQGLGVASKIGR